jgi:hypothetical protein
MSDEPGASGTGEADEFGEVELITDVEVIDAGPLVLGKPRLPVVRGAPQGAALVQTAAVAATGFVAGVATAAVLGRRRQRRLAEPSGSLRPVSRRTYLVDIHLLERG